jgi:photosystem II stability/assembly factor-like uncharacterized protein
MSVSAPPRPPRSRDPVDRDELEALIEALIEEARQRARRRRRRYAACILLVALAAGGVYFGFDHAGGGAIASQPDTAGSSGGVSYAARTAGGRWRPSRGPYGGPADAVAVAPSAPEIVYVGTRRGVFKSRNGGRSWTSAGLATRRGPLLQMDPRITSLAVDPRAPTTVYAARSVWIDGGMTLRQELFKSTNGGRSWRALGLEPRLVAIRPARPTTVYAIVGPLSKQNRLFRTTNGGRNWQAADRGLPSTSLSTITFDPTTPATVYVATGRGVFKSTDGGTSWRGAQGGLSHEDVSAIAVDPQYPQTVYAGTDGGVLKSLDGGRSWRIVNTTMGSHGRDRGYGRVSSLFVDSHDSQTIYATTYCAGIFKSTDSGRRWRSANPGPKPQCLDFALTLDPRAPQTVYAGTHRGVFKSTDGALRWHASNSGLSLTRVSSVALDPRRPRIVYASTGPLGLFRSRDGGAHWWPVVSRLKSVDAVALDPRDPRIILAFGAGPRGIRSTNAGRTWQPAGAGLAAKSVTVLAISGERAYAGTSRGVFSSADGGRSWHGLPSPGTNYVQALAIAPNDPDVVYAGGLGSDARGLYKSTDGGSTWQRLTDTLESPDVYAVALDPKQPTTVYIGTAGNGVFKSADGGTNWQRASSGLPRIRMKATTATGEVTWIAQTVWVTAVAVDPAHPKTLYAATAGRGIFRTTDAGESWHPVNAGLTVLDVMSLGIDARGRTLYAGTAGGGVVALRVSNE